MKIIKTQEKPLNLNITLTEIFSVKDDNKPQALVINPMNGRIIIGDKKENSNKEIFIYTVTLTANIKGNFAIEDKKESLKELKISLTNNIWINKLSEDKSLKAQINASGEKVAKLKPYLMEIIRELILQYKNSYEFFKRLREDVSFYVKFEENEQKELILTIKELLQNKTISEEDAPLP